MQKLTMMLAVGLLAAPLAVFGQSADDGEERRAALAGPRMADPVARVLALSEELGLSGEQVAQLDVIQTRLQAANEPLLEQLREALPEDREQMRGQRERGVGERRPGGQRGRMTQRREHMEAIRPLMREVRENRQEAANEIAAVLTPEQQAVLDAERDGQRQQMRQRMRERR